MVFDGFGGADEFDGYDVAREVEGAAGLGGAAGAEGVVVFHAGAGGEVRDAGGGGEADDLVAAGGGGVLGDHEARVEAGPWAEVGWQAGLGVKAAEHVVDAAFGDAGDVTDRDGEGVEGDGQGHAVEVAGGDHVGGGSGVGRWSTGVGAGGFQFATLPLSHLAIRKHQRIIRYRAELGFDHGLRVFERVPGGAEDLGGAPERVGVLHARVVERVRGDDLAVFEERGEAGGNGDLAALTAGGVDAGVEEGVGGAAGVDGHRSGGEGGVEETFEILYEQGALGGHEMSAVDEGEAFFGFEGEGFESGGFEGAGAGDHSMFARLGEPGHLKQGHLRQGYLGVAFADEDQGDVGQGGEVAGGADGAGLRDDGCDAGVEEGEDGVDQVGADAREAAGEGGGEEEHRGADDVVGKGGSDAGGVGANEVLLEVVEVGGRDSLAGEGAEAGVDAVVGFAVGEDGFEGATAAGDGLARSGGEVDGGAGACDGDDGGDGQGIAGEAE